MDSNKQKKWSPVDVTNQSQNKPKQMVVNFIPVDELGDASESTSTSSVSKMNTLKQSAINTVLQEVLVCFWDSNVNKISTWYKVSF